MAVMMTSGVCLAQTAYRVDVVGGTASGDPVAGVQSFSGVAAGDVTADVFIDASLVGDFVAGNPVLCGAGAGDGSVVCADSGENFIDLAPGGIPVGFGCSDGGDGDGDGLTDSDDPDCNGIQGWSISVNTGACFGIATASTAGTAASLVIQGGLRDFQSFEKTEVVDPALNGDLQGAVSAVVLSLSNPVILPQVGASKVLVLTGAYDGTDGCPITVIAPDGEGLRGAGEPVKTAITVSGETEVPTITSALIGGGAPPVEDCAVAGDEDGNGLADCEDPACVDDVINCPPPPVEDCAVAGDEDGNGLADCEDPACVDDVINCPPPVEEDCTVEGDEDGNGLADCDDAVCAADKVLCPPPIDAEDCAVAGDEDGNGLADCDDPACADDVVNCPPPVSEDCAVAGDEDGNGLADCDDPACADDVVNCPPPPSSAQSGYRVNVVGATNDEAAAGLPAANGTVNWELDADSAAPNAVTVNIMLQSAVEPCQSDATACTGAENFVTTDPAGIPTGFGCSDGMDNDGNGLTDSEDPDCSGVQGWSLSVITEDCFNIASATTAGTAAALVIQGGLRDFQSFEKTEVVDPANNLGISGAVSAVVLSLSNPAILPQTEDSLVLVLGGSIDGTGLAAGEMTAPCAVSVADPSEAGLAGAGEPVKTAVTIAGETDVPVITNASIKLVTMGEPETTNLVRGDPNGDNKINIADAVYVISAIFRDGAGFDCEEAADANGDGSVDASDAAFIIAYRFMGGPAPSEGCAEVVDAVNCENDTCEL